MIMENDGKARSGLMINEVPFPHLPTILHNGGFDFLIVDAEHGGFDYSALGVILMNARYAGIPAIVRLADNGRKDITKLMDMGAGVAKAKPLLLNSQEPVSAIAQRVGCANVNTFIRIFKKEEGVTPAVWKGRVSWKNWAERSFQELPPRRMLSSAACCRKPCIRWYWLRSSSCSSSRPALVPGPDPVPQNRGFPRLGKGGERPAQLDRPRLVTCMNCSPPSSSSLVMLVRVLIFPLIFLPTWGRTNAS